MSSGPTIEYDAAAVAVIDPRLPGIVEREAWAELVRVMGECAHLFGPAPPCWDDLTAFQEVVVRCLSDVQLKSLCSWSEVSNVGVFTLQNLVDVMICCDRWEVAEHCWTVGWRPTEQERSMLMFMLADSLGFAGTLLPDANLKRRARWLVDKGVFTAEEVPQGLLE
jgi:hypothetical protein